MDSMLSHDEFAKLNQAFRLHLGIYFPESRRQTVHSGLKSFIKARGIGGEDALRAWLFGNEINAEKIYELANFITNGETYFFREHRVFELLSGEILPGLLRKHSDLVIWSAGCSSGEEPYSLAMTLLETGFKPQKPIVYATDINQRFLESAQKGIFSRWSFRKVKQHYIDKYFKPIDGRNFQISEEVKQMVRFSRFNLVEDDWEKQLPFKKNPHLIFCRNVLIYFTPENIEKVVRNFGRILAPDGYFISGATEPSFRFYHSFRPAFKNGLPVYTLKSAKPAFTGARTAMSGDPYPSSQLKRENCPVIAQPARSGGSQKIPGIPRKTIKQHRPSEPSPPPVKQLSSEEIEAMLIQGENQKLIDILNNSGNGSNPENKLSQLLWLARAYANIGNRKKAKELCQQALQINKLNPQIYYWLGVIEMEEGDFERAREHFRKSLFLNPDYALPHVMLAQINRLSEESRTAEKHLNAAIQLLKKKNPEEIVYEADGLTVETLLENLKSITG